MSRMLKSLTNIIKLKNPLWHHERFRCTKIIHHDSVKVYVIPALKDNYMYVLIDKITKTAAAIDPVEPDKVLTTVEVERAKLTSVLTTHHHYDHAGGNQSISQKVPNLEIYGGDDRIDCLTHKVAHDDIFTIGSVAVKCLFTPCHTSGHICYYMEVNKQNSVCFTGDTLFVGGCGRFFEGTAEDMLQSLHTLAKLPLNTQVYCGHEYTLNNLMFAVQVEPDNVAAKEKLIWCKNKRDLDVPTVPTTIGDELTYNPFMRVMEDDVQKFTKNTDPVKVMVALRSAKDNF